MNTFLNLCRNLFTNKLSSTGVIFNRSNDLMECTLYTKKKLIFLGGPKHIKKGFKNSTLYTVA